MACNTVSYSPFERGNIGSTSTQVKFDSHISSDCIMKTGKYTNEEGDMEQVIGKQRRKGALEISSRYGINNSSFLFIINWLY
jgi:hypothetical protein